MIEKLFLNIPKELFSQIEDIQLYFEFNKLNAAVYRLISTGLLFHQALLLEVPDLQSFRYLSVGYAEAQVESTAFDMTLELSDETVEAIQIVNNFYELHLSPEETTVRLIRSAFLLHDAVRNNEIKPGIYGPMTITDDGEVKETSGYVDPDPDVIDL